MDRTITDILNEQLSIVQSLEVILKKEKGAIQHRDNNDMTELAEQKLALVNRLQENDETLAQHADNEQLKSNAKLKSIVDDIKTTLKRCHHANDVNGLALSYAQQSNAKLRNLFTQSRGKSSMTYGCDGQTKNVNTLGTNLKA